MLALCLYTVTGWGVMSCVYGMAFLCGSTLVKVPLLKVGTITIWPQMLKSNIKQQQTNKYKSHIFYYTFLQVPNGIGAGLGFIQVSLFCVYPHTKISKPLMSRPSILWRRSLNEAQSTLKIKQRNIAMYLWLVCE